MASAERFRGDYIPKATFLRFHPSVEMARVIRPLFDPEYLEREDPYITARSVVFVPEVGANQQRSLHEAVYSGIYNGPLKQEGAHLNVHHVGAEVISAEDDTERAFCSQVLIRFGLAKRLQNQLQFATRHAVGHIEDADRLRLRKERSAYPATAVAARNLHPAITEPKGLQARLRDINRHLKNPVQIADGVQDTYPYYLKGAPDVMFVRDDELRVHIALPD